MSLSTPNNSSSPSTGRRARTFRLRELILFAMLGALMFCSRVVMAVLPNIHLVGMLTVTFTVVFRKKALIPLYLYVLMEGLFSGFAPWWIGYLYIWTLLWGATMLLPKSMPRWALCIVYPLLCGLHGALFGILYAPAEALMFGLNFEQTVAWVIAGLPFDLLHCVGDVCAGMLVYPLSQFLRRTLRSHFYV